MKVKSILVEIPDFDLVSTTPSEGICPNLIGIVGYSPKRIIDLTSPIFQRRYFPIWDTVFEIQDF